MTQGKQSAQSLRAGESIEIHLERGKDGKLHWTGITFHGLQEDALKAVFTRLLKRAERNGWTIEVGEFVPYKKTTLSAGSR